MHFLFSLLFVAIAKFIPLVSAHTEIFYPVWRDNSFVAPFSQTIYPCAGISDNGTTPRTPWPLTGGSLNVTLHDAAAYIFINIGLGANATNFNYTLYSKPLNETGAGNLCFPQLILPPGLPIEEGTNASIQFATAGHNGEGLYNCADITFTANASLLPSSQCANSSTVTITPFSYGTTASTNSTGDSGSSSSAAPSSTAKASSATSFMPPSFVLLLAGLLTAML